MRKTIATFHQCKEMFTSLQPLLTTEPSSLWGMQHLVGCALRGSCSGCLHPPAHIQHQHTSSRGGSSAACHHSRLPVKIKQLTYLLCTTTITVKKMKAIINWEGNCDFQAYPGHGAAAVSWRGDVAASVAVRTHRAIGTIYRFVFNGGRLLTWHGCRFLLENMNHVSILHRERDNKKNFLKILRIRWMMSFWNRGQTVTSNNYGQP